MGFQHWSKYSTNLVAEGNFYHKFGKISEEILKNPVYRP